MAAPKRSDVEKMLRDFAAAHPRPTLEAVLEWAQRFPNMALEIEKFAMERLGEEDPSASLAQEDSERSAEANAAWDRFCAAKERFEAEIAGEPRFSALVKKADTDFASLAATIGIDQRILNSLESGRITLPVGHRLVSALARALGESTDRVARALTACYSRPRIGLAKAEGHPGVQRIGYAKAIDGSDMSAERKAYWKAKD